MALPTYQPVNGPIQNLDIGGMFMRSFREARQVGWDARDRERQQDLNAIKMREHQEDRDYEINTLRPIQEEKAKLAKRIGEAQIARYTAGVVSANAKKQAELGGELARGVVANAILGHDQRAQYLEHQLLATHPRNAVNPADSDPELVAFRDDFKAAHGITIEEAQGYGDENPPEIAEGLRLYNDFRATKGAMSAQSSVDPLAGNPLLPGPNGEDPGAMSAAPQAAAPRQDEAVVPGLQRMRTVKQFADHYDQIQSAIMSATDDQRPALMQIAGRMEMHLADNPDLALELNTRLENNQKAGASAQIQQLMERTPDGELALKNFLSDKPIGQRILAGQGSASDLKWLASNDGFASYIGPKGAWQKDRIAIKQAKPNASEKPGTTAAATAPAPAGPAPLSLDALGATTQDIAKLERTQKKNAEWTDFKDNIHAQLGNTGSILNITQAKAGEAWAAAQSGTATPEQKAILKPLALAARIVKGETFPTGRMTWSEALQEPIQTPETIPAAEYYAKEFKVKPTKIDGRELTPAEAVKVWAEGVLAQAGVPLKGQKKTEATALNPDTKANIDAKF